MKPSVKQLPCKYVSEAYKEMSTQTNITLSLPPTMEQGGDFVIYSL